MNLQIVIASAALFVSAIAFVFTYLFNRKGAVVGRQPILVFEYDQVVGWRIRNIGNGPAMNVVIQLRGTNTEWRHQVRIPSLAKDGEFTLSWIGHFNARMLAATYSDFESRNYTTISQDDTNKVLKSHILLKPHEDSHYFTPASDVPRHWNASELSETDDDLV